MTPFLDLNPCLECWNLQNLSDHSNLSTGQNGTIMMWNNIDRNIGDRSRLPRGMMTGGTSPNPQFWQSVHLSGDASAAAQLAAAEKEKKDWEDKVVVDHLDFKVVVLCECF